MSNYNNYLLSCLPPLLFLFSCTQIHLSLVSEPSWLTMATPNQSNAKFQNEVHKILGRHESNIDEVHATLQIVLQELEPLRASQVSHANNNHLINVTDPERVTLNLPPTITIIISNSPSQHLMETIQPYGSTKPNNTWTSRKSLLINKSCLPRELISNGIDGSPSLEDQ